MNVALMLKNIHHLIFMPVFNEDVEEALLLFS